MDPKPTTIAGTLFGRGMGVPLEGSGDSKDPGSWACHNQVSGKPNFSGRFISGLLGAKAVRGPWLADSSNSGARS